MGLFRILNSILNTVFWVQGSRFKVQGSRFKVQRYNKLTANGYCKLHTRSRSAVALGGIPDHLLLKLSRLRSRSASAGDTKQQTFQTLNYDSCGVENHQNFLIPQESNFCSTGLKALEATSTRSPTTRSRISFSWATTFTSWF